MRSLLKKNSSIGRVLTLINGTLVGQLILFSVTPLLSRMYTTAAFGDFGIFLAIVGICSVFASLRLEAAIPVAYKDSDVSELVYLGTWLSFLFGLMSGCCVFLFLELDFLKITIPAITFSLLVACSIILTSLFQLLTAFCIRNECFSEISGSKISQSLGLSISQVCLGIVNPTSSFLVAGDSLGRIIGLGYLVRSFMKIQACGLLSFFRWPNFEKLKEYKSFPLFSAPAALINALGLQAPVLLLGVVYEASILGLYIFANRIVAVPIGLISRTASQVYLGELGYKQKNREVLLPVFQKYVFSSFVVVISLLSVAYFVTPFLIPFLFGNQWDDSIKILQMLLLLGMIQIPASIVSQTLNATSGNHWQLVWDILRFLFVAVVLFVIVENKMAFEKSIEILCIVNGVMYMLLLIGCYSQILFFDGKLKQENIS